MGDWAIENKPQTEEGGSLGKRLSSSGVFVHRLKRVGYIVHEQFENVTFFRWHDMHTVGKLWSQKIILKWAGSRSWRNRKGAMIFL